jgi:hypothetical protein
MCEDIKDDKGRQVRARTVGRRVWGSEVGVAQWALEAADGRLLLIDLKDKEGPRVHQRFSPPDGYDSAWHSDCVARAIQVAQWCEEQEFNGAADLLTIERASVQFDLLPSEARQ